MHPQAWNVASGHVLKLELLVQDSTYTRISSSPHSVQVRNLELRVPTTDSPGSAEGLVQAPLPSYLPPGYTLARNVIPAAPSAPQLTSGSNPNANGEFTLSWEASQAATAPTYTLQHKNASGGWSNVATGLTSSEYTFTSATPEGEGTWTYRVSESNEGPASEPSRASAEVKVDQTPPNAPTAAADRAPDYAGGGGWYKDSVSVSFTDNGDPLLADGSSGSGVNPSSIPAPQTFNTDGAHEASGTVADNVGNVSGPGTLTVQVDATAPTVEISCPPLVSIGATGVNASVSASDAQSGLALDPSGSVPIDTSTAGPKLVSVTAIDNVGHQANASCTTMVGFTQVISGTVKGKLVIKSGQAMELTSTAKVSGTVTVKPGGAIDVEGATLSGSLSAKGATLVRICEASLAGPVKAINGTGSVVMGEGTEACASNSFHGVVTVKGNSAGVLIDENAFHSSLKVQNNAGGVTVTNNTVAAGLTVTGNTGAVVDTPNEVEGKSKLQ